MLQTKHDITIIENGDRIEVNIYTNGDCPSFSMMFDGLEEVQTWIE